MAYFKVLLWHTSWRH